MKHFFTVFPVALVFLAPMLGAAETAAPAKIETPGVVALQQETGGWGYRQFPTGLRLYISDKDTPGTSNCNRECSFAWPPLLGAVDDKPTGDWTLVKREDGRRQWAYKGYPVYMLFHDSPAEPQGDNQEGVWHILKP